MVVDKSLAETFSALGDATRLEILARLARGPASCGELASQFEISQQAVSKHIRVLREARLLRQRREGRIRVCELSPQPLDGAAKWIERNRALWNRRFDRLDAWLKTGRGGRRRG